MPIYINFRLTNSQDVLCWVNGSTDINIRVMVFGSNGSRCRAPVYCRQNRMRKRFSKVPLDNCFECAIVLA